MGFFSTQKIVAGALALLISAPAGGGGSRHTTTVYLRGEAVKVGVYEPPPGAARRPFQLLVISGDLGWLGISRNVPGHMNGQGYRVVTLNAQSYVARFTGDGGREHLTDEQVAHDFDTIMEATNVDSRHPPAYASVGVSEG